MMGKRVSHPKKKKRAGEGERLKRDFFGWGEERNVHARKRRKMTSERIREGEDAILHFRRSTEKYQH